MHERGTTVETYAKIAAKNWNYGAVSPMSHRQPDHEVTPDEVLASRMVARAAHVDDVLSGRRRRGVRDPGRAKTSSGSVNPVAGW